MNLKKLLDKMAHFLIGLAVSFVCCMIAKYFLSEFDYASYAILLTGAMCGIVCILTIEGTQLEAEMLYFDFRTFWNLIKNEDRLLDLLVGGFGIVVGELLIFYGGLL